MSNRSIRIRGARTNNLKDLDVDVPRSRVVVFVGVSGSGKSSLVFDTIAAEAGYQLTETYPPYIRNRLPKWTRPEVGRIEGLSPVVVIDQRRLGGNARSTVGTVTDTWTYLRLLFSRVSTPHVGESSHFSFNDAAGMCPTCSGLGEVVASAVDRFIDEDKALSEGAVLLPGFATGGYWYTNFADIGVFHLDKPLRYWSRTERDALLYGTGSAGPLASRLPKGYQGIVERFERIFLRTSDDMNERKKEALAKFTRSERCPDCHGDRLNAASRSATVLGRTIGEMARMEIGELAQLVTGVTDPIVAPVVSALTERLRAMVTIGLGYLHLGRATTTLSGGESQRIKTVKHLGSSLTEMVYVFDEPTTGLHPHDVSSMTKLLEQLRDQGNTVLVVEHDVAVMAMADQIIEVGPRAGAHGGTLVYQGSFDGLRTAGTATAEALSQQRPVKDDPRTPRGHITVANATRNNLKNITTDIPAGVMTVLTGVAGSGKSSLASELVAQHDAVVIDQKAVSTNRRSTPITYTGIATALRKVFARHNHVPAGLFSANSEGACPECKGLGVVSTDLAFMEDQETVCETCQGRRFTPEVLRHKVDGLSIADVDDLTITNAIERLSDPAITKALRHLQEAGLGYLRLGQPLTTLSGGECQRVKIARELRDSTSPTLYVLDEPTTGLHLSDIDTLLSHLDSLVDRGHTVVLIEHNLDVIRRADWIIDLGPGPGKHGGRILYEGPVAGITGTATAEALHQAG
ncbi:ATP-binding cassette domain-containing protein [Streptomyces albus subsp. chlorinus]|uniref:ATP-binding cassette domain-containing protein n=1 Tax=Streptomyces albus TaxID=1888 RepID=UPI001570B60D|nr:ATP-binding cassette domain-containing protein [Streptomyces albus]NSC25600.1 ATP-binding cassette domain-containing protein [Streptomyces albus subsp. chlorinus]